MYDWLFSTSALVGSFTAAIIDVRSGRIPNWITLPLAAGGLALQAFGGWRALLYGLSGLALAGGVPWLFHCGTDGRAIGGGDVKLFAGLGALTGPMMGLEIELSAFVLFGVFAMVRLAFEGSLLRVFGNVLHLVAARFRPRSARRAIDSVALTEMRLGPAIALGVVSVMARDTLIRWLPWLG